MVLSSMMIKNNNRTCPRPDTRRRHTICIKTADTDLYDRLEECLFSTCLFRPRYCVLKSYTILKCVYVYTKYMYSFNPREIFAIAELPRVRDPIFCPPPPPGEQLSVFLQCRPRDIAVKPRSGDTVPIIPTYTLLPLLYR